MEKNFFFVNTYDCPQIKGDLDKMFSLLNKENIKGFQIPYDYLVKLDKEDFKRRLDESGIKLLCTHIVARLLSKDESVFEGEINDCKRALEYISCFGCEYFMVVPFTPSDVEGFSDRPRAMQSFIEGLKILVEEAKKYNIKVAIENISQLILPFSKPEDLEYILENVAGLGFCFDTGNFLCTGVDDSADAFERLKDRIVMVHIKELEVCGKEGGLSCDSGRYVKHVDFGKGDTKLDYILSKLYDHNKNIPYIIEVQNGAPEISHIEQASRYFDEFFGNKQMKLYDIIIKNGLVVDGSGKEPFCADVGVFDGKIAFVGDLSGKEAKKTIDAKGKYVTPGFIDTHSHSDSSIWINPEAQSSVRQGVTTEIVGNCGFSMRHTITVPFDEKGDGIECVYDLANKNVPVPKGAFKNTLDKMEKMGASVNTAWLIGHNDLRVIANLNTVDYTEEQFSIMENFIREAMEAGYIGFSTGLEFDPGILSKPEEVERLASVAAEYDGIYTTHMRDEGTYIFEAVEEFLNVIRKTKMRGMISHLNVKYDNGIPNEYLTECMNKLKNARRDEGLDVFTDMLSTTYGTGCAQAMLPPWLYENGWDKAREILADKEGRERVKADMNRYWRFLDFGQWDRLLRIVAPHMPEVTAMSFEELCKAWNREPADAFLDVFMKTETIEEVRAIEMVGVMFSEQTMIDTVVNDDIYLWMSDSYTTVEEGDARTGNMSDYMGYLYFFTRYVKELGVISIEKAVNKATKRVADHYRLENRGQIKEGFYADINIFELDNLKINATFTAPCKYCTGPEYVIVNGVPVIEKGEHTGKRSGMVLRRT